ncbi:MAG: T9SS type A sorting domain-containing protein [Fibrobacteres bacterium]|nr:T9SS type A sorting domain-containing protein [Fibrobacterota bacterium]
MEKQTKRIVIYSIAISLLVLFAAVNKAYGGYVVDSNVVTLDRFLAFYNLTKGNNAWTVQKVADYTVSVDGIYKETEWSAAQPIYIAAEWQWTSLIQDKPHVFANGPKDFLAVWRLVYDSKYLYISCDFRDDVHNEGLSKESWYDNDCVELSFVNPPCLTYSDTTVTVTSKFLQIHRKFTDSAYGLKGRINYYFKNANSSPDSSKSYIAVGEGDSRVGGVKTATRRFPAPGYSGRWLFEAKIPLCLVSTEVARGKTFKMNLRVFDRDSSVDIIRNPTYGIGLERYSKWYKYDSKIITDPLPTFIFAGLLSETPPKPIPDLANLYCGRTVKYYDSFLETAAEQEQFLNSKSILSFNVSPNPVTGSILSVNYNALQVPVVFSLFDASGRLLNTNTSYNVAGVYKLNSSALGLGLPTGQYFMRMETADNRITRPVLIIR